MAFKFRKFSVNDDRSSMKVGTDAVLLGAWAGNGDYTRILDIGTGSGLISLMLAQRFEKAMITAIDIHPGSVVQALENFKASPWHDRITAREISLQDFAHNTNESFDLIVSNPPFFSDSLMPPDPSKKMARHDFKLRLPELIESVSGLIDRNGAFSLILPYASMEALAMQADEHNLFLSRELLIYPTPGKSPNRFLSEWARKTNTPEKEELVIRSSTGEYSNSYRHLTAGFYLAL